MKFFYFKHKLFFAVEGAGLYEGLEEKLFFSLFSLRAHRKKVNFQFGKTFFMQANPVFIETPFLCVQSQNKSWFFTIKLYHNAYSYCNKV